MKDSSTVDEEVATVFLHALIPIATEILSNSPEVMGFADIMVIMASLAGSGSGHIVLIKEVFGWLENMPQILVPKRCSGETGS